MSKILSPQRLDEVADAELESGQATVLIVDDEPLNRFLIAEALAGDRYHTLELASGEEAVEYLTRYPVDLILLDIDMPGMGGLAACAAIRALPQGKLVPIAMVTGLDDNVSIEQAFDCGATDFFTKPVNWPLMRQRVRFMLRHGSITRELQRNEQILEQVHAIAEIGHWRWDIAHKIIYNSAAYRRLLPGLPAQLSGATLDAEASGDYGRLVLAEINRAVRSRARAFRFECSAEVPQRGNRRMVYHGNIEYGDNGEPLHLISTVQDITQRYQDEERYAVLFNESPIGIVEADCFRMLGIIQKPGFFEYTDVQLRDDIAALMALPRDSLLYARANPAAQRIMSRDDKDDKLRELRGDMLYNFLTAVRDKQPQLIMQCHMPQKDGGHRDVIISARIPANPEEFRRIVFSFNDITDLVSREAQLKRADAIIANTSDAVVILGKDQQVLAINPAYTKVTGYTLEQLRSINMAEQLPAGPERDRIIAAIGAGLSQHDYYRGEIDFVRSDGSIMPALLQINIVRNERGEFDGAVTITSDISHIKESERRLYQLAHFDALTGLPNRLTLLERLQSEFDHGARAGRFCLLYIDLDGFKLVNDSMGHPTGDALLREVSARLGKSCRNGDLLTRIGGDEFALLMVGAGREDIDAQAERFFAALGTPYTAQGREIFIGASIGACRYPEDAASAEDMLRNADSAMYEAKRLGRGQLSYYSVELTSVSNHRLQIENELRVAISSDHLFLVYQPKCEAVSGAIVGAEALVRWRNPQRGVVAPGEFISIAEASGLIIPLGEWVINEACRQLAEWQREHGHAIPLAINISALHLRNQTLLQVISDAIERFHIDPQLLEIEITEDSLDFRGEDDKPYHMLNQLSELGLSIAIDDFGTGYSSLSQLKKMPISTLKIDGSFVRDIAASESDHAIISAIVGLAKTLEMGIVAEGVENEQQAYHLRKLKCDVLQGFFYSKPLPPEEFLQKFLAQLDKNIAAKFSNDASTKMPRRR